MIKCEEEERDDSVAHELSVAVQVIGDLGRHWANAIAHNETQTLPWQSCVQTNKSVLISPKCASRFLQNEQNCMTLARARANARRNREQTNNVWHPCLDYRELMDRLRRKHTQHRYT